MKGVRGRNSEGCVDYCVFVWRAVRTGKRLTQDRAIEVSRVAQPTFSSPQRGRCEAEGVGADELTLGPSLAPLCLLIMAFDSSPAEEGGTPPGEAEGGREEERREKGEPRHQNKKPK
ncbi:hypothetical protein E2C01_012758 [Portunus trituberculatus]|uniref:Uncharacterized protein n=1 Tax=Portunus trituberculatus TaxID=210409 RepID=A0A5B7DEV7_PORTR|nr:hypothetical protein [Portunus trituberculatus]